MFKIGCTGSLVGIAAAASVQFASAQPEYSVQAWNFFDGSVFELLNATTPVQIEDVTPAYSYKISANERFVGGTIGYAENAVVGPVMTASRSCDDFIIIGPGTEVVGRVRLVLKSSTVNRPGPVDVKVQITHNNQIFDTWHLTQPVGDSSETVELTSRLRGFLVGTPIGLGQYVETFVGSIMMTQPHSATAKVRYPTDTPVFILPSGYTVNSTCAHIVDNMYVEPEPCPADTNNDGMLSPADFSAWVAAFNAQASACDQNGDGSCSPADFSAWVANYNAGC